MSTAEPRGSELPVRIDFILGLPRSGSTWLGRALGAHPDIAVFGETSFWGRLYVPPRRDGLYGEAELRKVHTIQRTRDWSKTTGDEAASHRPSSQGYSQLVDAIFAGVRPPISPADLFAQLALGVARAEGASRVIEKTPHHVHWLPRLGEAFPSARFVVMRREPYGFVSSFCHLGDRLEERMERIRDRPWRHPALASLFWSAYGRSIERALERYPERIALVDLAEIERDPRGVLRRVAAFLGVERSPPPARVAGRNSSFRVGPRREAGGAEVFWVNLLAGRAARRAGYERRPIPFEPGSIAASFLTLPLSLAVTAIRTPSMVPGSLTHYIRSWVSRWRVSRNDEGARVPAALSHMKGTPEHR